MSSPAVLKGVVHLIFEKAISEPMYSPLYAQLSKRLSDEYPTKELKQGEEANDYSIFMRILVNLTKTRFEKRFKYYFKNKEINEGNDSELDEEEKRYVAKQKMLGNIKFIGELFLLDQINGATIHKYILHLLDFNTESSDIQERCLNIECLCQFIKTCGKNLDTGQEKQVMDQYFLEIANRSQFDLYPPRIRFMLRDVIELRDNAWTPRSVLSDRQGTGELTGIGQRSGGR